MIELSKGSQLAQQIIDFRLASDQYLLSPSFRDWHLLHSVDHSVKFVPALEDDAIAAFSENAKFLEVLSIASTEQRWLGYVWPQSER